MEDKTLETFRLPQKRLLFRFSSPCLFTLRVLLSLVLLALELTLLTVQFDTATFQSISHPLYALFGYSGIFLRFAVAAVGAAAILILPRRKIIQAIIAAHPQNPNPLVWLIAHLAAFALFYVLTWKLFKALPQSALPDTSTIYSLGIAWVGVGLTAFAALLLAISNKFFWVELIKSESQTLFVALGAGLLVQVAGFLSAAAWQPLVNFTFSLSSRILGLFFHPIVSKPAKHILGTHQFRVEISSQCSGYEGMGLITVFLGLYLWLFRHQLRFPQAYWLIPFGIAAIWLLNVLRIVALISMGHAVSPEIAAGGFHSNAGWIAFVGLSVFLVMICQKSAFFNRDIQKIGLRQNNGPASKAIPLLMPFIVLLATMLITAAFSGGFDWLYPLKVVTVGTVLWCFRSDYRRHLKTITFQPLIIGTVLFLMWLVLIPPSQEMDHKFANTLFSQNVTVAYLWLFFRLLGASLTVPITEELAFRGYLLAKLVDVRFERVVPGQFTWFSFLISSLMFGLLHGEWLAGCLAGMGYACALYQRRSLFDAVIAHMTTNFMLSIYVFYSGHWSLW